MKEKCKDNISTPNFLNHLTKFNEKENEYHNNKRKLLNVLKTTSLNIISLLRIIFIKDININDINTNIEAFIKIFETSEIDDVQPIVEFIYYDINEDMVSDDMKKIELYNNNFKITACELDDIFKKIIDIKAYNYYNVVNITTTLHKNIENKLDDIILQLNKFINNNDENAVKLKEYSLQNKINLFNILLPYNNVKTEINDEYTDKKDIYEKQILIGGNGIDEDTMIQFDIMFLTKLSQIVYLLFQNFLYLNTIITKKTVKKQINTIKEFNKIKSVKELKEIEEIKKLSNIEDLFINFYNKSYYLPTFITYNDVKNNDIQIIIRKYYNIIIISVLILLIESFLIILKTLTKYTKNPVLFTKIYNIILSKSDYLKYLNTNYEESRVLFQNIEMIIGNMFGYMIEHVNEIDVKNQTIITNMVSANDLNMIIYIFLYYSYHNIYDDTNLLKKPLNPVIIPDTSKVNYNPSQNTNQSINQVEDKPLEQNGNIELTQELDKKLKQTDNVKVSKTLNKKDIKKDKKEIKKQIEIPVKSKSKKLTKTIKIDDNKEDIDFIEMINKDTKSKRTLKKDPNDIMSKIEKMQKQKINIDDIDGIDGTQQSEPIQKIKSRSKKF